MPSEPLSPDNDYQFAPAPAPAVLDRAAWDLVMGGVGGIGPRLRALEAVGEGIEAIKLELQQFGLDMLDEAITPLITSATEQLTTLQTEIAETIAETETALSEVQEQVDLILAGGIPAGNVEESAERVFVSPGQRDEIGQLRVDLGDTDLAVGALAAGTYSKAEIDGQISTLARRAHWLAVTS